ncbi:MAG: MerR family transcriptional regulator [Gammaproteobacteria bacterium]|nr:MerR family transcriptional regulator [Gammaproteobacteria bacterium]
MFPIGAVERDTGIGRDTLRVWERRYGFPVPERNSKGERVYSDGQVRILQLLKRLLDQGMRPGKIVGLKESELNMLAQTLQAKQVGENTNPRLDELIECVAYHKTHRLWALLEQTLIQQGMKSFVVDTIAPLVYMIGDKWAKGELKIFEEHFLTRQLTLFLDAVISKMPVNIHSNSVLLATLPGEHHSLGLLMLEGLLRERGLSVINLGTEVPMDQLTQATEQYQVKSILLSFSSAYNTNGLRTELIELAGRLPDSVSIYVGGEGVKRMRKMPAQIFFQKSLQEVADLEF